MQNAGQVEPRNDAGYPSAGDHVVGDEAAQRATKTLLLVRDDRGVRDRDAERVAKQRGNGEPVGDAPDEAGLGGCLAAGRSPKPTGSA